VRHYSSGLALHPDDVAAQLDLAKVWENLGDLDAAAAALRTALRLAPDDPVGRRRWQRVSEERRVFEAIAVRLHRPVEEPRVHFLTTIAEGVDASAQKIIRQALARACHDVERVVGLTLPERVVVHVLSAATVRSSWPPWAAGVADGDGSMALFLRSSRVHPGVLAALVRHEFCHVVTTATTGRLGPLWLHEAVAERLAKPRMAWEEAQLQAAIKGGCCLPLRVLEGSFWDLPPHHVSIAYRQCARIGEFLFDTFRPQQVAALLAALRSGAPIADAFPVALDLTVERMEECLFSAA
jgi:hypothetical protein